MKLEGSNDKEKSKTILSLEAKAKWLIKMANYLLVT